MEILIEYTARQDTRFDKAFKPQVFVNGKWIYTISRCKKTMQGAIKTAKQLAEDHARSHYSTNVTIRERK